VQSILCSIAYRL